MAIDISIVGDMLAARGLLNPALEMLKPNEQSYRALLLQPAGPILADAQRIGPLDIEKADERGRALLTLAKARGNHLVVTPEYFLPLKTLLHCVQSDMFPAPGVLWVLGCESITPPQLEEFKKASYGHSDVFSETTDAAAIQGTYYDPIAYCFVTKDAEGIDKRVVLFQFKTCPSRDEHYFENKHLRIGNTIYQFKGEDDVLSVAAIICSDAFTFSDDDVSRRKLTDRATLIHIQLNPKPRHVDYRKYRTETFSKSPEMTNCDILCLNWAQNIIQHDHVDKHGIDWKNIGGSAYYLPPHRCSTNDQEIEANEKRGLYYSLLNRRRHVLLFHYDEAAFELTVPKIVQLGPAVQDNKLGPQLDIRFTWNTKDATWLEDTATLDAGLTDLLNVDKDVASAFGGLMSTNKLQIERAVSLSCGPSSIKESWYRVDRLDSCQMGDDEIVPRTTFCMDKCQEAESVRFERVQRVSALNIILNKEQLPRQIRDLEGGGTTVSWDANYPNTNVIKDGVRPALVAYLGHQPHPDKLKNISDAAFELLRIENGAHKHRAAVCYRKADGTAAFTEINALTDITYDGSSMTNITGGA